MVRSGPWKYNYYHGHEPELFNLQDDPAETVNLAGDLRTRKVEDDLHARALQDWDPEAIGRQLEHRSRERALIAEWERRTRLPEPDPPWFETPPENWVNANVPMTTEGEKP
jgi:choline-sulfatase